jgi:hypothetical protein
MSQRFIRMVNLPSAFTLRRPAWASSGVRITPATKRKLEAEVFDLNEYMLAQETTGEKHPQFGRYIAVPLRGARPTRQALIRPEDLPHAVMQAGGFIRNNIIYKASRLKGPGRGREGPRANVRLSGRRVLPMYYLVDRWKWRPRYGFRDSVELVVNAEYQEQFQKAFAQYSSR